MLGWLQSRFVVHRLHLVSVGTRLVGSIHGCSVGGRGWNGMCSFEWVLACSVTCSPRIGSPTVELMTCLKRSGRRNETVWFRNRREGPTDDPPWKMISMIGNPFFLVSSSEPPTIPITVTTTTTIVGD